jgi:hypothetical protein
MLVLLSHCQGAWSHYISVDLVRLYHGAKKRSAVFSSEGELPARGIFRRSMPPEQPCIAGAQATAAKASSLRRKGIANHEPEEITDV